jgi:hypothetical protein
MIFQSHIIKELYLLMEGGEEHEYQIEEEYNDYDDY